MTTVDEASDDASTGRYVETVVIASANANVRDAEDRERDPLAAA